jgi:hypothetical protein
MWVTVTVASLEQQHRYRLADDVRLADHHGVEAAVIVDHAVEQHHDAERGAGHQPAGAGRKAPDVDGVEPVDILERADPVEHARGIDARGQRQLDENAMHGRIRVELVDQRVEFAFRRRCRHAVFERDDPGLAALGDLAADIDLAGGIVTDQHHGEPGGVPVSATICRTSSAVRSVSARAMALPSMIWAICHLPCVPELRAGISSDRGG